jgi:manganese oxidase
MIGKIFGLLAAIASLSGCESEGIRTVRSPFDPYPKTGVTKTFELTITENVPWEVGPGAIYNALTYNNQIPGPPIEVTAGDHITIRLTNNATAPHSIHTHITSFTESNDGVHESLVMPGETKTYEWDALYAGTFPYHDHGDESKGVTLGLFGAVIVHAPDETPANEHLVVLSDFDQSEYLQLPGVADPVTGEFPDAGTYHGGHQYMHTFNGKAYEDAIPPFIGKVGERQRWRIVSIGREFHTFHIHGHRWLDASGVLTDNILLGPGSYATFEFMEDNPGSWLVHCHVPDHMEGGMMADYHVSP